LPRVERQLKEDTHDAQRGNLWVKTSREGAGVRASRHDNSKRAQPDKNEMRAGGARRAKRASHAWLLR